MLRRMKMQNTSLTTVSPDLVAANAGLASVFASVYFYGWQFWFYFFGKTVKRT